jgi:rRNA-processing protein FCF1
MTDSRPRVLVDANLLLLVFTHRFPLEREIYRQFENGRIEVPSSVLGELERLADFGVFAARAAREFARRFPVRVTDLRGDAALETLARDLPAWVATADQELRRRLESQGRGVLYPRGVSRLECSRGGGQGRTSRARAGGNLPAHRRASARSRSRARL